MSEVGCFVARVRPERLDEYRTRHEELPADLLAAFERAGRRRYRLFIGDDGTVVGTYEADSLDASRAILAADPAVARWNAEMAPLFAEPPTALSDRLLILP